MQSVERLQACDSLILEHREMEKLLDALRQALFSHDLTSVRCVMRRIEPGMDLHFACEEQVLFPAVSPMHPMELMEVEHEELMTLRASIFDIMGGASLTEQEWLVLKQTGNRFIEEMLDHIGREDAGIFPTCERALSDEKKKMVIADMEQLRAKANL